MALFKYLSDDAFLIFSRKHRFLYEAALMEVHDRFFSAGAVFPTPQEVTHAIYDLIGRRQELLLDGDDPSEGFPVLVSRGRRRIRFAGSAGDVGDKALRAAGQLYQGLVRTGWLDEEEFGLKTTVDMPMGALLVVQRLVSLKSDVSQRFGGLVVHIKTSLELVERLTNDRSEKSRSDAVYGLKGAKDQADQFVKNLRAILSDLKRIRKSLMESDNLGQKMDTYFDEFIGELVLKDFQSILTFNHPYRFRDQIVGLARRIYHTEELLRSVAEGYLEIGVATDIEGALTEAESDLLSIESTFETVGEMFERIAQFRRALEQRLRNTVKYAEQGERGLASRARELVSRMDLLLASAPDRYAAPTVPVLIEPSSFAWSAHQLANPRQARQAIEPRALSKRPFDPVYEFRKRMKADYLERIAPSPERVRRFLRHKIGPHHSVEARFLEISTVDELLAFDAARRYALTAEIPIVVGTEFELEYLPETDPHDSEWLRCGNFIIRRLGHSDIEGARSNAD